MKTAFFGGSFNPPHVGHVLAASYALALGFDQVFVAVVKQHAFAKTLVEFDHRVRMAELAFEPMPRVVVSDIEAQLPTPSFTLQTLKELKLRHPSWELRLLVGSDVVSELPDWQEPAEVLRLAPLFSLGRAGHQTPGQPPAFLPELSSSEVRTHVSAGERSWLDPRLPRTVMEYIDRHQLYRSA